MPPVASKGKKTPKVKGPQAEVVYPQIEAKLYLGEDAVTSEMMKAVLDWQEEVEGGEPFGDDYLFTDFHKKKVRCRNNTKNRPFTRAWAETLAQDILNRHWADSRNGPDLTVNGEAIIIGRGGQVLSGQHRGIGLIFAEQMRTGPHKDHWAKLWDGPVSMEAVIVYGVDESGVTTRTLDNVKPRSLADVLFCDSTVFGKVTPAENMVLCKMCDHAIRLIWHRTGASKNAFTPRKTHSEAIDFLERHARIKRAVKHIYERIREKPEKETKVSSPEENKDRKYNLRDFISPGYASALLYLMAASDTAPEAYFNAEVQSEKKITWRMWDKACEFFIFLCKGEELREVRNAFADVINQEGKKPSLKEATVMLMKAWNLFADEKEITRDAVSLKVGRDYHLDENGIRELSKPLPTVGGIDQGDPKEEEDLDSDKPTRNGDFDNLEEDPEELERRTAEVRQEGLDGTRDETRVQKRVARMNANEAARKAKEEGKEETLVIQSSDEMPPMFVSTLVDSNGEEVPDEGERTPVKVKKVTRK